MIYLNGNVTDIVWNGHRCVEAYFGNSIVWSSNRKYAGTYVSVAFEKTANGWSAIAIHTNTELAIAPITIHAEGSTDEVVSANTQSYLGIVSSASPYIRPDKLPSSDTQSYLESISAVVAAHGTPAEKEMDISPAIYGESIAARSKPCVTEAELSTIPLGEVISITPKISKSEDIESIDSEAIGNAKIPRTVNSEMVIDQNLDALGIAAQCNGAVGNRQIVITTQATPFGRTSFWIEHRYDDDEKTLYLNYLYCPIQDGDTVEVR